MNTLKTGKIETSMPIDSCSVKVMRSHDYCHFEIVLGCDTSLEAMQVDELRKTAARLADKAVEQYKIAKRQASAADALSNSMLRYTADGIRQKPESERTPEEVAKLKEYTDRVYQANRQFDYEDDWEDPA